MNVAIIISTVDYAGLNIKKHLIEFNFKETGEKFEGYNIYKKDNIKIYTTDTRSVFCEDFDKKIAADYFIFPTTHRSESNMKSLTCHVQGNFNKAELGGKEKTLVKSSAVLLKEMLLSLNKFGKDSSYEISMECDHHGPFIDKPCLFIEIGSTENEWKDENAGKIITETIMDALSKKNSYKIAIGIGGTHYCSNFNKTILTTDIAISHVCPKYNLTSLTKEMLMQMIEKTVEKVDFILLDWKGLGAEKEKVLSILKELNLEYKRTDKL